MKFECLKSWKMLGVLSVVGAAAAAGPLFAGEHDFDLEGTWATPCTVKSVMLMKFPYRSYVKVRGLSVQYIVFLYSSDDLKCTGAMTARIIQDGQIDSIRQVGDSLTFELDQYIKDTTATLYTENAIGLANKLGACGLTWKLGEAANITGRKCVPGSTVMGRFDMFTSFEVSTDARSLLIGDTDELDHGRGRSSAARIDKLSPSRYFHAK